MRSLLCCYIWALYGPDEPAMATPSTLVVTAKTPTKCVQVCLCFLCGKNVATTSTYYKFDQDSRRILGRRFSVALDVEDIVDYAFRSGLGAVDHHLYACNACCLNLDTLESAAQIKKDMITAFTQTCHKVESDIQVQQQKRLVMDSPSVIPGTKKPSKCATAATRPLAQPCPPQSLFANIGNVSSTNPASDTVKLNQKQSTVNGPGTKARQTLEDAILKILFFLDHQLKWEVQRAFQKGQGELYALSRYMGPVVAGCRHAIVQQAVNMKQGELYAYFISGFIHAGKWS